MNYRLTCPDCNSKLAVHRSAQVTALVRIFDAKCKNPECGHTFKGYIVIQGERVRSLKPNPDINLPLLPGRACRPLGLPDQRLGFHLSGPPAECLRTARAFRSGNLDRQTGLALTPIIQKPYNHPVASSLWPGERREPFPAWRGIHSRRASQRRGLQCLTI